jgi:hypothetical protein
MSQCFIRSLDVIIELAISYLLLRHGTSGSVSGHRREVQTEVRDSRFSIPCCLIIRGTSRGLNVYLRKKFFEQYNCNNSIQNFII